MNEQQAQAMVVVMTEIMKLIDYQNRLLEAIAVKMKAATK